MDPMELSYSSLTRIGRRQFSDYSIVFFCPLVVEQQAARLMLDEIHDDEPPRNVGQTIAYTFGKIASYNVAIAAYPGGEAGIGISGSMVAEAQRDFGKHLEFGMLVGIGAGTPSSSRDIRLGDVAVAYPNKDNGGIVGYDMKKVEEQGEVIKQWQHATDPTLRSAMNKIQVHQDRVGHDFRRHLEILQDHPKFRRPLSRAVSSEFAESPARRSLNNTSSEVHYGTILSGNAVIKLKSRRDELRDKWDSIAIEMEAAGITSRLGVAVIRGISDFADSNKNDEWHGYAAIVAAAYAKELVIKLGYVRREQRVISPESVISIDLDVCLSLALPPSSPNFVGRESELRSLLDFTASQPQKISQASTLAVYGLGGVGKTQLLVEFVGKLRQQDDPYDIFWLTGETKEAFEQSITNTLKTFQGSANSGPLENYSEHRTIHIDSFFAELRSMRPRRWVLVVDGVSGDQEVQNCIIRRLQKLINGSVILTSRDRSLMRHTSQGVEIKGLYESDAVKLLRRANADGFPDNEKELLELAITFKCHPLSLSLAASAMSYNCENAVEYVAKWNRRQFEYGSPSEDQTLSRCFEVSFAELQKRSSSASMLLMLFGYLDHGDMWLDLCQEAIDDDNDDDYPTWLQEIAQQRNPQQLCFLMRSFSFVEPKKQGPTADLVWEIHPVIHEFSRQRARAMGLEEELVRTAISLVAAKVPRSQNQDFLSTVRRLALHAEQCKIYMDQERTGGIMDLVDLKQFGDLFRHLGRYDDACEYYTQSLVRLSEEPELDDSDLELKASLENNLGLVYHHQKEYQQAVRAFEVSRQTYFQVHSENNGSTMSSLYNIGRSLMMQNQLDLSLSALEQAAAFFKPSRPSQQSLHPHGSRRTPLDHFYYSILNDIGEILLRKGEVDKAEGALKLAFKGQEEGLGGHHPATFPIRLNLGRVCVKTHRFGSARKIFQHIVTTYIEWWGKRHSETMRALEELSDAQAEHGRTKRDMGDDGDEELSEATSLMREVAEFHYQIYGEGSSSARSARLKLQKLQEMVQNGTPEDDYAKYYSTDDVRRTTI